jgi:DNA-binding transcriptional ArsR family regulator
MSETKSKTLLAGALPLQERRFAVQTLAAQAAPGAGRARHVLRMGSVLSNGTRASILQALAGSPDTLCSMQVEELSSRIGTSPRVVIYHLEKLRACGLVEVKKSRKYGRKERRSIWGLDARNRVLLDGLFETGRRKAPAAPAARRILRRRPR